jgi:hypothetical protein
MFEEHPRFQAPDNPDVYIWRYVDLAKYISLLDQRALYFCRGDKLIDQFEGSLPRPNVVARSMYPHFNMMVQSSDGRIETGSESEARAAALARAQAFVNCWHMNNDESAAMWQLYSSNTQGIAIRSTYRALRDAFTNYPHPVYIGIIKYIDYGQEAIIDMKSNMPLLTGALAPLLYKRRSYQHEAELRAMVTWQVPHDELPQIMWREPEETGVLVPVDLGRLIESVFVAPNAEPWFHQVVKSVSAKYGLSSPLRPSRLDEDPLF